MKYIIEVFSVMLVLVFNLLLCVNMLGVSADVAAAKEFKAAMIAEIENSDFNPYVIDGCKAQAGTEGYELEVQSKRRGRGAWICERNRTVKGGAGCNGVWKNLE